MSADIVPRRSGSDKLYWGPRLWRMFHLMAEISDRRDVSALWQNWIRATADAMPCELCRTHLKQYIRSNSLNLITNPTNTTGLQTRDRIRMNVFNLHNEVNKTIGKPVLTMDQYTQLYGGLSRNEIVVTIRALFLELQESWKHVSMIQWRNIYYVILSRVASGPD